MSTLSIGGQLIENTDYSTGEVKTGARWIDGKPIYRRVLTGTTDASVGTSTQIDVSTLNIDNLIKMDGYIKFATTGSVVPINYYLTGTAYNYASMSNNKITVINYNNLGVSRPFVVILEYTKTS